MSEQLPDFEQDIPLQVAMDAHRGTSFLPEKRAEQERADYAQTLIQDRASLDALADTPEKSAALVGEFARYREGYKARTLAYLSARARCMSAMITGPANFPITRNSKKSDAADKRLHELLEYREHALDAIRKTLQPELRPIMSGDMDAIERLKSKIAEEEVRREAIKARNLACRKAGLPPAHEPWELTNRGANIRRMKQRAEQIKKTQAIPPSTVQGVAARIEDCPAQNRVRLFFPGKPAEDVRAQLKQRGFRWTPSLGCWQAFRNSWALESARSLANPI